LRRPSISVLPAMVSVGHTSFFHNTQNIMLI
jgi:hypothetical protein